MWIFLLTSPANPAHIGLDWLWVLADKLKNCSSPDFIFFPILLGWGNSIKATNINLNVLQEDWNIRMPNKAEIEEWVYIIQSWNDNATLRPSGILLFSALPMMISQNCFCVWLFWIVIEKIREIRVWRNLLKWFDRIFLCLL